MTIVAWTKWSLIGTSRIVLHWGDVPSWVAAIGTVGALIVALYLGVRELIRARVDRERADASQVTGWLDIGEIDGVQRVRVLVCNKSGAASTKILAKVLDLTGAVTEVTPVFINGVPPTGEPVVRGVDVPLPSEPDQEHYRLDSLQFTDGAGIRWDRSMSGLRKIS